MMNKYTSFLKENIEKYISYRTSLGYSKSTYTSLSSLDQFLTIHYQDSCFFTKEMFDNWIQFNDHWNNNTLYKAIIQVSNLCMFIGYESPETYVPPKIIAPKWKRYQPCILSDDEIINLFEIIDNYKSPVNSPSFFHLTGPVLFRMIFLCGLRPNEPCNLLVDDIDLSTGKIKISDTKSHQSRQIYMSTDLCKLCQKYDEIISLVFPEREYFFIKRDGKKLETYNIGYYLNNIKNKLDNPVFKKLRVYDFRHNFATRSILNYLENDTDIYSYMCLLSAYMGHSTFDDTFYYISLLPSYLKNHQKIDWSFLDQCIPEV